MRIQPYERVVYEHNPLAEVVCQIQFKQLNEIGDDELQRLKGRLAQAGYPDTGEQVARGIVQQINAEDLSANSRVILPSIRIHLFTSLDGIWRVSFCPNFVALTCFKYSTWGDFLSRMLAAVDAFLSGHGDAIASRIGLRYKDLIEREPLGLAGVPWTDLIKPFLLGPLAVGALADGQATTEKDIENFLSQTQIQLEDAKLLLQSALLESSDGTRRAFLVDADFYNTGDELEPNILIKPDLLTARLNALHANAGALFRQAISERLHRALLPQSP